MCIDEPVFGCYLDQACGGASHSTGVGKVPLFVQRCVSLIESSEENMQTDGLYRASGNLSQIQKIRLQIDQNNYTALEREEDVHVLTGALKLFFRELKEPLIPYKQFTKAIKASTTTNKKERLNMFVDIVKSLPTANRDTLKFLLQHLLKFVFFLYFYLFIIIIIIISIICVNIAFVWFLSYLIPKKEYLRFSFLWVP
uniref:Rho-GAP domain-containing protein n=1 Tax=Rhodnius prolixus TaxID=13249 RepID=T1HXD3_RHOPR